MNERGFFSPKDVCLKKEKKKRKRFIDLQKWNVK